MNERTTNEQTSTHRVRVLTILLYYNVRKNERTNVSSLALASDAAFRRTFGFERRRGTRPRNDRFEGRSTAAPRAPAPERRHLRARDRFRTVPRVSRTRANHQTRRNSARERAAARAASVKFLARRPEWSVSPRMLAKAPIHKSAEGMYHSAPCLELLSRQFCLHWVKCLRRSTG